MKETLQFEIYSFYRFVKINDKNSLKLDLENFIKNKNVKGTILLADEGFNGTISGNANDLKKILLFIKKFCNIRKVSIKINSVDFFPFNRLKIRHKKEIVSLGIKDLKVKNTPKKYIHPKKWDKFIREKDINLIDTRNTYEISIGKFNNAINPLTKSFRDFPEKFNSLKLDRKAKIGIYCTGGIRCEKASTYLFSKGFKNVYQLEGGILNYLNYKKKNKKTSKWSGECFVFDKRVSVNQDLNKGSYFQCYGCRRAITSDDIKSKYYKKGVYCPKCINERTEKQKKNSGMRQSQINNNINFF